VDVRPAPAFFLAWFLAPVDPPVVADWRSLFPRFATLSYLGVVPDEAFSIERFRPDQRLEAQPFRVRLAPT